MLEPLAIAVLPPLDETADNIVKAGSVVPHKISLSSCGNEDVTSTASVTARITLTRKNGGDPDTNVVPSYAGQGDAGGVVVLSGAHYQYKLEHQGAWYIHRVSKLTHSGEDP